MNLLPNEPLAEGTFGGYSMDTRWILHGYFTRDAAPQVPSADDSVDTPWILHGYSVDTPWILLGYSFVAFGVPE